MEKQNWWMMPNLHLHFLKGWMLRNCSLFVDIVDKPVDVISNSAITEAAVNNVGHDNVARQGDCNNEAVVSPLIDWDNLEIIPLAED